MRDIVKVLIFYRSCVAQKFFLALRRMLVFEQAWSKAPRSSARQNKLTSTQIKRSTQSHADGPFALNRLANRARFSRTSAMRFFCPLFHNSGHVYKILSNERYSGKYTVHGETYTNTFPKIVSDELFDRVAQIAKKSLRCKRSVEVV